MSNYQGGKEWGLKLKQREDELDDINKQFLSSGNYDHEDDLEDKLTEYKAKFIKFDEDCSGDIDEMEMKRMLEKLGNPKTHMEIVKMIKQVDTTNKGTISYADFLVMMLGGKNSVLRTILLFETLAKPREKAQGIAKKKSLADLGIRADMAQHLG